MWLLWVFLSIIASGTVGTVHAFPLENIITTILESEGKILSIELNWNYDETVSNYEIGCVSCIPNFAEKTGNDRIVLHEIGSLENGPAILYVIAYDDKNEIIVAKQVIVNPHTYRTDQGN